MGKGFGIQWEGLQELTTTIYNAHGKVVEQAQKVLKNNGEEVKYHAMEIAPYDTGFLKQNIETSYYGMVAEIRAMAGYSGFQEYGTRYQSGKPFMKPSIWIIQPTFERDLTDVMKGVFK